MSAQKNRNIAMRRLKRDLIELQRANIVSIAAQPLDNNIFEWHVNIKPTDGVYSGVYFHLIMLFPETYPSDPPRVKICTQIKHPNIWGEFLCIDMLRMHGEQPGPYAAWSNSYSATSILMQLQSFLFAERIDQYSWYGTVRQAKLSHYDVTQSLAICKSFQCERCGHSHNTPWPKVKGPAEALIKVFPTDPESGHVTVQGSSCQTTHTNWVGAYGEFGCNYGKIFYEAFINWTGDKWAQDNIRGGLCRFGFGTENASNCGRSRESFGYGGTGMYSWANQFNKFGEPFTKDDTITVAVDFDSQRIYFAKNGALLEPNRELYIPNYLQGALLFPILSFKSSRAEFNFGIPKKPCKWLIKNGFKSLEQVALEQGTMDGEDNEHKEIEDNVHNVDWHHYGIIDELWVSIFESLEIDEIFLSQFVCKKWYKLLGKYNIMERNEIQCYFTKAKLGQSKGGEILGIGLTIKPQQNGYGYDINSQMDILSLNAWQNGCKRGVWGEVLTHFLPLVMNRKHAEIADKAIHQYLKLLQLHLKANSNRNQNELDKYIERNPNLQLIDILITMMNQIVVQFVMGNVNINPNNVSMIMCEKVVLGYCALHHLLLYLVSKNKKMVKDFANRKVSYFTNKAGGCNKSMCKDLGKFLIYLMISKYSWSDVANTFVKEVFTRNVRWMLKDNKYSKYDTTQIIYGRLTDTFNASRISRRLVMFQVWFMKNNANETLQGYNQRLGRPRSQVRNGIVSKTKYILGSKSWWNYFDELGVIIKDENTIDQLLRFAIYNSKKNNYHRSYNNMGPIQRVNPPRMDISGPKTKGKKEGVSVGIKLTGDQQNNMRGSGWRGRGRGGRTRYQNVGRGRGKGQAQQQPGHAGGRGRGFTPRQQIQNQNTVNRNINNNNMQIQRQQPVMIRHIANPNQNQYGAPPQQKQSQQPKAKSKGLQQQNPAQSKPMPVNNDNNDHQVNERKTVSKSQRRKRRKKGNKDKNVDNSMLNKNEKQPQNMAPTQIQNTSNTEKLTEEQPVSKAQRRKRRKKRNNKNENDQNATHDKPKIDQVNKIKPVSRAQRMERNKTGQQNDNDVNSVSSVTPNTQNDSKHNQNVLRWKLNKKDLDILQFKVDESGYKQIIQNNWSLSINFYELGIQPMALPPSVVQLEIQYELRILSDEDTIEDKGVVIMDEDGVYIYEWYQEEFEGIKELDIMLNIEIIDIILDITSNAADKAAIVTAINTFSENGNNDNNINAKEVKSISKAQRRKRRKRGNKNRQNENGNKNHQQPPAQNMIQHQDQYQTPGRPVMVHQKHQHPIISVNNNRANINANMIQKVLLCEYYRSARGCALGQRCNYRH